MRHKRQYCVSAFQCSLRMSGFIHKVIGPDVVTSALSDWNCFILKLTVCYSWILSWIECMQCKLKAWLLQYFIDIIREMLISYNLQHTLFYGSVIIIFNSFIYLFIPFVNTYLDAINAISSWYRMACWQVVCLTKVCLETTCWM